MEDDITNWKSLWEEEKPSPFNITALIERLLRLEKKEKRERIFVLITFPLTLIFLGIVLPIFESNYFIIAISCIGIAMLMLLLQLYRSKLKHKDEVSFNNQAYIQENIKKLQGKMTTTSRYMWGYTFLLLLGLNIGYVEVLKSLNFAIRVGIHAGLSIAILCFMFFSIRRRIKKNEKEILPLIDALKNLMD
ncbi:hypothetical protein [Spongiimicrobium salis]|uniref:hypothetical protein n=1 Tax=Spongiimicrobium salis TaxID=1667022 RepID=UPI00374D5ACA